MSQRNFYYRKEAEAVAGSANFAGMIATGFATFGLSSAQSTAFGALDTSLQSAWSLAIEPSTRTSVTIAAKTQALKLMRQSAVQLSRIVYATSTVTDAQLISLGLLPRSGRTPIPPFTTAPVLEVGGVVARTVTVRLHAAGVDGRCAIPAGSKGANVYSFVGAAPPADPSDWRHEGLATRAISQIVFPADVPSGASAWLTACWVSNRGATGPACEPVPVTIQGGATLPAAA